MLCMFCAMFYKRIKIRNLLIINNNNNNNNNVTVITVLQYCYVTSILLSFMMK